MSSPPFSRYNKLLCPFLMKVVIFALITFLSNIVLYILKNMMLNVQEQRRLIFCLFLPYQCPWKMPFLNGVTQPKTTSEAFTSTKRPSSSPICKKPRFESRCSMPPFKVHKHFATFFFLYGSALNNPKTHNNTHFVSVFERWWQKHIQVRKEKLGDRIAALQQLVSPFGKVASSLL